MNTALYTARENDIVVTEGNEPYILRLRDLPADEKPREKLLKYGPDALDAGELLAIVLNTGTKKEEVLTMTKRILKEYGEKGVAHERNAHKMMKELDIPEGKACQVIAAFELGRRFFMGAPGRNVTIRTARQAYMHLKDMRELPKEHLRGLYVNNHYRLIHDEVISIGSVSSNIIHPREVFRPALEYAASAVIVAHNHPSGNLKPSYDDIEVTKQLVEAGKVLGIDLLDHIIISRKGFASIPVNYADKAS